ncbi:hypothetical protein OBBRIDRAFT_787585 [Obba rivulosa]|uniref:Uncharacterized protein n=1 Tax=Obba rivulosa TaxID=1052685 RepID=A0A8E2DV46_9APHY|nr:hypothetical protein OBBRIDRAFT_787585 [Obba rivulosa]
MKSTAERMREQPSLPHARTREGRPQCTDDGSSGAHRLWKLNMQRTLWSSSNSRASFGDSCRLLQLATYGAEQALQELDELHRPRKGILTAARRER